MSQDHALVHCLRPCPGIDPPWNVALLTDVVEHIVGGQILFRAHPLLAGTRLDACCFADEHRSFVVFYRPELPPEQATRMQLEVLGRILLGQVTPDALVCYTLCRGTPIADALLAPNGAQLAGIPARSRAGLRALISGLAGSQLNAASG